MQVRLFDYMVKAGQPPRRTAFPGQYGTRKIRKSYVDSRPTRSTSKWSRMSLLLARFPGERRRSSCIKVAALIRRPPNTQGEHNAFHDDHVSERIRNRESQLCAQYERHGENGRVQRG